MAHMPALCRLRDLLQPRKRDNPTECSGPPHLLGPWGSAGLGAAWSGLLIQHRLRPATCRGVQKLVQKNGRGSAACADEVAAMAASLDAGFAEFHVLLRDRIVFLLHQLVGHRARIL